MAVFRQPFVVERGDRRSTGQDGNGTRVRLMSGVLIKDEADENYERLSILLDRIPGGMRASKR